MAFDLLALAPHRAEVAFALAARALAEAAPRAAKKKDTQHAHILKWFTPLITHATQPLKTARKRPVTAKRLASGAGGCDG